MKIDRNKGPPPTRKSKWAKEFDKMKPGDSLFFEGSSPSTVSIAFGLWLARGKYSIQKEDGGYRFYWLKGDEE